MECATRESGKCYTNRGNTENSKANCENFTAIGYKKQTKKFQSKFTSLAHNALVTHGVDAQEKEFPFMVRLRIYKTPEDYSKSRAGTCGGTMLHDSWILTAAHCIYEHYDDEQKVPFDDYCFCKSIRMERWYTFSGQTV